MATCFMDDCGTVLPPLKLVRRDEMHTYTWDSNRAWRACFCAQHSDVATQNRCTAVHVLKRLEIEDVDVVARVVSDSMQASLKFIRLLPDMLKVDGIKEAVREEFDAIQRLVDRISAPEYVEESSGQNLKMFAARAWKASSLFEKALAHLACHRVRGPSALWQAADYADYLEYLAEKIRKHAPPSTKRKREADDTEARKVKRARLQSEGASDESYE